MRIVIPLIFGEIELDVHRPRRSPSFWACVLLSALLHALLVVLGLRYLVQNVLAQPSRQQPEMVVLSSAMRIERRPRPAPPKPHILRAQPRQAAQPRPRAALRPAKMQRRRELAHRVRVPALAFATPQPLAVQLQTQERQFEQTIAQARAANNPVIGAANPNATPGAPIHYRLNLQGDVAPLHAEGYLEPLRHWTDGPYSYYYVIYTVEYADGSTERGTVPWPIHFPIDADPFARGIHHMPLPGPPADWVPSAGVAMNPLVKNCYDHRYDYCPIEHE
jgi:hypothetical protein